MSNQWKPILSDEEIDFPSDYGPPMTAYDARYFYESLITSGKLRVVEEVELIDGLDRVTYIKTCPACNTRQPGKYPFCPGCGNKIKRTKQ